MIAKVLCDAYCIAFILAFNVVILGSPLMLLLPELPVDLEPLQVVVTEALMSLGLQTWSITALAVVTVIADLVLIPLMASRAIISFVNDLTAFSICLIIAFFWLQCETRVPEVQSA